LVFERAGDRRKAAHLIAFIQQWGNVVDEAINQGELEPTVDRYCERWGVSRATAHRDLALFREAFPSERTPQRILAMLWEGLGTNTWSVGSLMGVRVVTL
jgi:hypothetical protein